MESRIVTFESAFSAVSGLVHTFAQNERYYMTPSYQEAEARKEFIDKFFIALGWDVNHDFQKNPYEQEVKVERAVAVAKNQKRADYAFFVAPNFRTPLFYVEAKKPSRDLKNADDYFQAVRYGWNTGNPITVLTDFQEFHILDCRYPPNIRTVINSAIEVFDYKEYTNEETFRKIYHLFSRDEAASGSFAKFLVHRKPPKGKKLPAPSGILSIDDAFLNYLDTVRDTLAKAFKKTNPNMESTGLTEAVQRTVDRFVFIRFLEDKLIEPDHYISRFSYSESAWADFLKTCRALDAKYNGIVFKPVLIDAKNFIPPEQAAFASLCRQFSHEESPYNFNLIPVHILGSIYERFLGKIVIATDKRVRIEEKHEVKKAGGVYYTPQYIVEHIVRRALGGLLEGKTPAQVKNIRCADIACGSGSFLITVYEVLLDFYKKYYQLNPKDAKKDGCVLQDGVWHLSLKQKQQILRSSVFGIDVDPQAVEVTMLSLYLKLLEDESLSSANDMQVLFKEKLLPDLTHNIICGNSLIGPDIFRTNLFEMEEELRLKPLAYSEVFPEIMRQGGFDVILGNPPYGAELSQLERKYCENRYRVNNTDTACLFMELAKSLVKEGGAAGYIVPKPFLFSSNWKVIRRNLLPGITEIVDCGKVWNAVKLEQVIYFYTKGGTAPAYQTALRDGDTILQKGFIEKAACDTFGFLLNGISVEEIAIGEKLLQSGKFLNDFVINQRGAMYQKLVQNMPAEASVRAEGYSVLGGKQINRFEISEDAKGFIEKKFITDDKAFIKENALLVQNIVAHIENPKPHIKIICAVQENSRGDIAVILDTVNQLIIAGGFEAKFMMGLLNSKLISWYSYLFIFGKAIRTMHFDSPVTSRIPMPAFNRNNNEQKAMHDSLTALVDQMIETKKRIKLVKTDADKMYYRRKETALENSIDALVYRLYGLTDEEVGVITG